MNFITETSAYFVPDQCLFGSYPTQQQIQLLEDWGVDIVVNLTSSEERKIKPYVTNARIVQFPIPDRGVPEDVEEFCALVLLLIEEISRGKKIYIHCKGGHGRSGLLVAAILCQLYRISTRQSFFITSKYHSTRPVHSTNPKNNEMWKKKGSPQTIEQKRFVENLFQTYEIPEGSPFEKIDEWRNPKYEKFLRKTFLSRIIGANGRELEIYRNSLFEN